MQGDEEVPMTDETFDRALENASEIEVTTIGRTSGGPVTLPVWFALRDGALFLLPLRGSDTGWYKNLQNDPTMIVAPGRGEHTATAVLLTDPAAVEEAVDAFRAKYGDEDVRAYYPKTDVAVRVPLA
jgi:hypothetical protein